MAKYRFLTLCAAVMLGAGAVQAQHAASYSAGEAYEKGKSLFMAGNYGAARNELEKGLRNGTLPHELAGEAEYMIVCSSFKLGDEGIYGRLQQFLRDYPDTPHKGRIAYMMGADAFRRGKWDKAAEHIAACDVFKLGRDEREEALRIAGLADLKAGRLETAEVSFMVLKGIGGRLESEAEYNLAYIAYMKEDYGKASRSFEKLRRDSRFAREASYYIADIYCQQGQYAEAKKAAEEYFAEYGRNDRHGAEMYRILGMAMYYTGDYEGAVKQMAVYFGNNNNPTREASYVMGMSSCKTRRYDMAVRYLKEVTTEDDAKTQNAYLNLGISYLNMGDKPKALMAFQQASATDYDRNVTMQALYNYALCVYETSYSPFNESVKVFERMLNEYPGSSYSESASNYLSDAYLATTNYDEALNSLSQIANPDRNILRTKQILLFRSGVQEFTEAQYRQAVSRLSMSLELPYDRDVFVDALYWRGEAYYRLAMWDKAEADFARCLSSRPAAQNKYYYMANYNMGYICFKRKDYDGAASRFSAALAGLGTDRTIQADAYNRMGDCYYHSRSFQAAETYYGKAADLDPAHGDYPLFQKAFILGLQKNYSGKIQQLDRMLGRYPSSSLADDAMFEKGRAYVMSGQNDRAIDTYNELVSTYPHSTLARRALSETALLYSQKNDFNRAAATYKKVITQYPGSEEARQAYRDFKSLCVEMNMVDEYVSFSSAGGRGMAANSEIDSLTYLAAERLYFGGNEAEGVRSMQQYVAKYPEGIFSADASYHIGVAEYKAGRKDEALGSFARVIKLPDSKYAPEAMRIMADIYEEKGDYDSLKGICTLLGKHAQDDAQREAANRGLMRSCYRLGDYAGAVHAASALAGAAKTAPELLMEARYTRAKSYVAMHESAKAAEDYRALAADPRTVYGAEAGYRLAEMLFQQGDYAAAEKEVMAFIEKSTPHAYWLARGFILLSDVYARQGRNADARQYLLSLQQNYSESAEINSMIEERLEALKNK